MRTYHIPGKKIKSAARLFDILEAMKELEGATLSELANELGMAKSTVHDHLSMLRHRGYVIKEGDEYNISLLFLDFGSYSRRRYEIFKHVKPKIDWLANETGERTQFMIEEHGLGYDIYRAQGEHAVRTGPRIGNPIPLHTNAAGKALLSTMSEEEVDEVLDHWGLPAATENTIVTRDGLLDDLEETRERGYSLNCQESRVGLWAIGVPICRDDECLGSISVSGPVHRIRGDQEETIIDQLLGTANEIELNIL